MAILIAAEALEVSAEQDPAMTEPRDLEVSVASCLEVPARRLGPASIWGGEAGTRLP